MFQFLMFGDKKISHLRELHALEVAAEAIYRRQIWRANGSLKESIKHAAENEKKHKDNILKLLEKLGGKPHLLRYPMYVVGSTSGFISSIFGKWAMMISNILFETQAVFDYKVFLKSDALDEESRELIKANINDEKDHIRVWESYLWGEN